MAIREAFLVLGWLFSDPLVVGTQAPDFKALDQDGKTVKLSDYRGSTVVLAFFYEARTKG